MDADHNSVAGGSLYGIFSTVKTPAPMMQRLFLLRRQASPGIFWMLPLTCFHILVAVIYLQDYLSWSSPVFFMGLLSLVFVIPVDKERTGSLRYGYAALLG